MLNEFTLLADVNAKADQKKAANDYTTAKYLGVDYGLVKDDPESQALAKSQRFHDSLVEAFGGRGVFDSSVDQGEVAASIRATGNNGDIYRWIMSQPEHAELLTSDDIKHMPGIRGHVANISESWRRSKLQEELAGLSGRVVFNGEDDLDAAEKLRLDDLRKQLAKPYNGGDQFGRETMGQIMQSSYSSLKGMGLSISGAIGGGLAGSEVPIIGNIIGARFGSWAASYDYNSTQEAGNAYEEYLGYLKANGIDTPEAVADASNRAAAVGRINANFEFLPGLSIAKNIPGLKHIIAKAAIKEGAEVVGKKTMGQTLKIAAKNVGETMLVEGATEGLQEAVTMGLSPEQFTARQYLERIGESAKIGALMGGGMGLPGPALQVAIDYHEISKARQENKMLRSVSETVNKMPLSENAPDKQADALRIMGLQQSATVDAQGLAKLLSPEHLDKIDAISPGFKDQLVSAAKAGDTFTMPAADFVAKVAKVVPDAVDHITLNQSAVMTAAQAMEREKWLASPELAAKLDAAFKTLADPEFIASTEKVYQHELTKQAKVYGDTPAAKAHAKMMSSFMSSMAHLTGMSPEEFYAGGKGKAIPYQLIDKRKEPVQTRFAESAVDANATTNPENPGQVAADVTKEAPKAGQVVTRKTPSGESQADLSLTGDTQAAPETLETVEKTAKTAPQDGGETLYQAKPDSQNLAPNGKPSKLTPAQWRQVRTPEFKAWFGDWENDPANASKVVDENGEPMVVYHGTSSSGFTSFDQDKIKHGLFGKGVYLTDNSDIASSYTSKGRGDTPGVYSFFVNIRAPINMDAEGKRSEWEGEHHTEHASYDPVDFSEVESGATNEAYFRAIENEALDFGSPKSDVAEMAQDIISSMGYDGINHIGGGRFGDSKTRHKVFIAFNSEQIKSAIANRGTFDPADPNILNQPVSQDPASDTADKRGFIDLKRVDGEMQAFINILPEADESTFLHEFGHLALQTVRELARAKDAPEQVVKLWVDISKEFGITGKEITREQHERFARSFEAYLREGKAPSPELQGVFELFADWLMQVYRSFKDLRVKMNPRINALMDRVIASHAIVQNAEAESNAGPMMTEDQMTPEKWQEYQDLTKQATDEAQRSGRASMLAPLSSDIYAENAMRREIQAQVQEEIMQQPVYQALDALRRAGAGSRLNKQAFIARFGEAAVRRLEKHDGRSMFTKDGTGDIDVIANQFGFGSGEALVYAMNAAPTFEATVKAETRVRLAAKVEPIRANAKELAAARKDMIEIVRAEFEARPIYQLIEELAEGVTVEDGSKTKLNTQDLLRRFGDPTVRQLSAHSAAYDIMKTNKKTGELEPGVASAKIHNADGTLDLESFATSKGYADSEAMIQEIANTPPLESAIEREAQKRLLGDAGDPLSLGDEAIQAAAIKALHTDGRGRMIAFELQALRLRANMPQGRLNGESAAYLARERIRSMSVKEATAAHKFAKAETRASVQAEHHLRRGEIAAAVAAKEMQLIQHHLTREALQAQKDQKASLATITREKKSKDPIGIDPEYHGVIRSLLAKYGFIKTATQSDWLKDLSAFVDRAGNPEDLEHYSPVMIAQSVINGEAKNWKDLTLGELDDLRQSLDSLRHVGQMRDSLNSVENKAQRAADIEKLNAAMVEAFGDNGRGPEGIRSAYDAVKRGASVWQSPNGKGLKSIAASILKIEELCNRIDKGDVNGIAHRLFWNKLEAAKNHEGDLQKEYTTRIREVIKRRGNVDEMEDYFDIPDLKNDITPSSSFTREMAIVAALNMGNAGNIRNLLLGRGWTREQLQLLLDKLSAEDWAMAQGIWTTINGFYPGLDALHREATGVPLAQVEAVPFTVVARNAKGEEVTVELSGGYYPIVHATELDKTGRLKELKAPEIAMENTPSPLHPKTASGMMKARNDKAAYPLSLSISGLSRHMEQTIHTLTHQKAIQETSRILRDPALTEAFATTAGDHIGGLMMPWLQDVARPPENADKSLTGWDAFLRGVRQRVQLFGLGYRLKTVLAQFLGFANITENIGVTWATKGLQLCGTTPEGYDSALAFALEQSPELRNRSSMWERDFRAATDHIATGPESAVQKVQRFAYWGIAEMDKRVSLVAWLGARAKYLAENAGTDIDSANRYADGVVRMTQGGTSAMDAAAFMRSRNEWMRMFSLFIGPMNAAWNRLTRLSHDFRVAKREGRAAAVIPGLIWRGLWLTAIPAVLQGLLLDPADNDEEAKDALAWAEWTARKSLGYAVGGAPVLRDVVKVATGESHGGTVTLFDSAYNVAKKAVKAPFDLAQGEIEWQEAALKEVDAAAWVFKLPVGQITLMLDNLRKAGEMDIDALNPKDLIIRRQ